jgi:peptidoglycan/xylan/chitin deacetylase (PgdA/CDA1 family)
MSALRPREKATHALDRLGMLDRLLWLRARIGRRDLAVLTYHRIGRVEDAGELDPGLFDATPAQLAAELEVLRAHATVVSLADVRRFFRGARRPPNAVLVTFDDAYADVEEHALPILRRAGVPATFFVPTAFPDGGRLFWWDRIWLLLRRCRRDRIELTYPQRLVLYPAHSRSTAARALLDAAKHAERLDLARLWEALEQAGGVALDAAEERALAARTVLGWASVRRLRDAGMDVQSHSHDHLILNSLHPDVAQRDLARSVRLLREVVGEELYAVAYPVGYELTGAHRDAPRRAGFELAFTNGTGLCSPESADPLNVPRVSLDLGLTLAGYKALLLVGDGRWARPTWVPTTGDAARPLDLLERASAEVSSA